jgi:hypothetical protein
LNAELSIFNYQSIHLLLRLIEEDLFLSNFEYIWSISKEIKLGIPLVIGS